MQPIAEVLARVTLAAPAQFQNLTKQKPAPDARAAWQPQHGEFFRHRERIAEDDACNAARYRKARLMR